MLETDGQNNRSTLCDSIVLVKTSYIDTDNSTIQCILKTRLKIVISSIT